MKNLLNISVLALAIASSLTANAFDTPRSTKRGFGENTMSYTADLQALARGCSWWYDWGTTPPNSLASLVGKDKLIEFAPMTWNATYNIEELRTYYKAHPGDKYLLGFNEPNFKAQSNLTPTQAAQAWPKLESLADELGLKLVAPALNYPDGAINDGVKYQPTEWMDAFIAAYKKLYNKEPRIDYLALHCYMDYASAVKSYVDNFATRYGKQVWLTEFCSWESQSITAASQEEQMIDKVMMLEKDPNVFRYAWFKARNANSYPYYNLLENPNASKGTKAGTLTDVGFSYVNMSRCDTTYYYKVNEAIPINEFVDKEGLNHLSRGYDPQSDSVDIAFDSRGVATTYQIDVPEDGDYTLLVRSAVENNIAKASLYPRLSVLDSDGNALATKQTISGTTNDSTYAATQIKLSLKAGKQKITISKENKSTCYVSLLKLVKTADANDADAQTVTIHRPNKNDNGGKTEIEPDNTTEYGWYGSAALDADGKTTFDFDHATDAVLIGTSSGVTDAFNGKTTANYNVDEQKNFLYVWEGTYTALGADDNNSFGWQESYNHYQVADKGWSGLGYASSKGNGKDLSMINDDYVLHIAFRGTADGGHPSQEVIVGNAKFTLGSTPFANDAPVIGDYKRDGSWTNFDIPVTALEALAGGQDLFTNASSYEGNVVAIMSGGTQGTDLQFDNIFFYKNPNVPKALPTKDSKTQIGVYASKAVEDGKYTFDFDNVKDAILISTSTGVTNALSAVTLHDYRVDDQKNFFYIWQDYASEGCEGANSFGWNGEGWTRLKVSGSAGWDGAGFASSKGNGKDMSAIDDAYYLHFAMKGDDALIHASQTVMVGNAKFIIGNVTDGSQILGDYKRDGEWYNFDIPVVKLKQLANGTLFDNPSSFEGNAFAVMTTYMQGAEVNFDNVFFYKKKDGSVPTLDTYVTKSLDENEKSTFDLDKAKDVVLIGTSGGVTDTFVDKARANYNVDDTNNFLYIWSNTYTVSNVAKEPNSFGYPEGYNVYTVGSAGWSGLGYASQKKGKDLSMLDDSYYLHFAMKGTSTAPYLITVGNAKFAIGSGYVDNGQTLPALTDFKRDGNWYSFDIPFSVIKSLATSVFDNPSNYLGNVFAILAGGTEGTQLTFDNVFFYKKSDAATSIKDIISDNHKSIAPRGIYDLQGRKLERITTKGIYIINGKKIVVK